MRSIRLDSCLNKKMPEEIALVANRVPNQENGNRKQLKFYLEIALLSLMVLLIVFSFIRSLSSGQPDDAGQHIKSLLQLAGQLNHGIAYALPVQEWSDANNSSSS